jgi:diaminopimelate epimerase
VTTPGIRFAKGHGTQNDFVILPDYDDQLVLTPELVRALCDRHAGIGADGVLRVVRGGASDAEWFMDYRNGDGSIAEMCGNGVRVFARFLVSKGLASPGELTVGTRAGTKHVTVTATDITVDMGPASFGGDSVAEVEGTQYKGAVVSMGNPHLVCTTAIPVATLNLAGQPAYDSVVFPDGVNVEFVNIVSERHAVMRVHERGVGETYSCGTGACAVAAATLHTQGASEGVVTVDVPGGRLIVEVNADTCLLTGPAVIVAEGVYT